MTGDWPDEDSAGAAGWVAPVQGDHGPEGSGRWVTDTVGG